MIFWGRFRNRLGGKAKSTFYYFLPLALFLVVWEIISRSHVFNMNLFPPPSLIWVAFIEWARSGELWRDVTASSWRLFLGFCTGGLLGVALGLLTGTKRMMDRLLSPIFQVLRPLPPVAIIPLIIVWLGIGDIAKVFSISFAVFFPVWINTHIGASNVSRIYIWSARTLSDSKWKIALKVFFPATLPSISAGLRTSIAIAFIMVFVSELAGASEGIGYQISISYLAYRIDKMMAALVVLAAAGALADFLFTTIFKLIFPWTKD